MLLRFFDTSNREIVVNVDQIVSVEPTTAGNAKAVIYTTGQYANGNPISFYVAFTVGEVLTAISDGIYRQVSFVQLG